MSRSSKNIWLICLVMIHMPIFLISQNVTEDFSSGNYNGGTNWGTGNNWIEANDDATHTSGYIRNQGNQLYFNYIWTENIRRVADLSAATAATLSLDWQAIGLDFNEALQVEVSIDGTIFTSLGSITGTTGAYTTVSFDISAFISAATTIRFSKLNQDWESGEIVWVDNIVITVANPIAPSITATGNQQYCIGNTVAIVESITITDADDTTLNSAFIHIANGFIAGEDLLVLTGSHPGITPSWDAVDGKLTLTGVATLAAYEAAIAAVHYSSSGVSPSGTRSFLITVGDLNVLPVTNHFYEFVPDVGISWSDARDEAAGRSYFGVQGYLATLTSQVESDYANAQISGAGWIGANDAVAEGVWRWVTGPEAGTNFWNGLAGGSVVPGEFAFWNTSEPNNVGSGGEDYAHITDSAVGVSGSWNDLPNAGGGGVYQAKGYVVEYGGMAGDAVLNVFATTMVTITRCKVITNRRITYRVNND